MGTEERRDQNPVKKHRTKKPVKKRFWIMGLAVACAAFLIFQVWRSYHCLELHEVELFLDKLDQEISLLVISDLHDGSFGEANQKLVEQIHRASPDLIVMDGDMINEDSENVDALLSLVEQLAGRYPVYYAWGNHELEYNKTHPELPQQLEKAGAVVLEETYTDITVRGQALRLGGMFAYAFDTGTGLLADLEQSSPQTWLFLTDFQDTEACKIMLAHRPDSFIFGQEVGQWDIDLVISGHVHGGQVVLPFLGGLWAPDQGWFPDYVEGVHALGQLQLVITRGLGSQPETLPRFNNPPEILLLRLCPKG